MNTNKFLIYFFCSLIVYACSCNGQQESKQQVLRFNTTKDIPMFYLDSSMDAERIWMEHTLKIHSLQDGYDSMQIRIWIADGGWSEKAQLVIFSNEESKWSAEFYSVRMELDQETGKMSSISKKGGKRNPKSGWPGFIPRLLKTRILELPDHTFIPDYSVNSDADQVTIEFATKYVYRIYAYPNVFRRQDKFWQAREIGDISRLIKEEFDFKFLNDDSN